MDKKKIREQFHIAITDYDYWVSEYQASHIVHNLIVAAQKWGLACGLAMAAELEGWPELKAEIDAKAPELFPQSTGEELPF